MAKKIGYWSLVGRVAAVCLGKLQERGHSVQLLNSLQLLKSTNVLRCETPFLTHYGQDLAGFRE